MTSKIDTIEHACKKLSNDDLVGAKKIIKKKYPFTSFENKGRQYTEIQKTKVFLRDGFIDRYSGERLVFPPVLKILSNIMPDEFPYQKHWKTSECHIGWWELIPTVDHLEPVSRGGEDNEKNWVCISQLLNSAKSNWSLEDLGWKLHEQGDKEWDGMTGWFKEYVKKHEEVLNDPYVKKWHNALCSVENS
tara:strand:+ start:6705 stop:7274 length:570 start_codon:yes stop_codon:yes gene_type:complete